MVDQREAVVQFMQGAGPVLPIKIAKFLNLSTIFASAVLSEMVARKMMKITMASIGGSPLYYLPGQEPQMDDILGNSLGGREKQAWQLLKERMVVREKDLEPWQRVAIKSLKDFAVQIDVNLDDGNLDTFWKHHLITDDQAKLMIAEIVNQSQQVVEAPVVNEVLDNIISNHEVTSELKEEILENNLQTTLVEEVIETPRIIQQVIEETEDEITEEDEEIETKEEINEELFTDDKKEVKLDGKFYKKALEFIQKSNAEIIKEFMVKKEKEFDFIIEIKTGFGRIRQLVKAKNKNSITEADISSAFGEGQLKRLPVILLTPGKLNKKAISLVEEKMKGQLIIKQI